MPRNQADTRFPGKFEEECIVHCVMVSLHPMIGADLHIPPPAPALTAQVMYGTSLTCEYSPKHFSTMAKCKVMCKGTDIGPLIIPHCPTPPIPPMRLALI